MIRLHTAWGSPKWLWCFLKRAIHFSEYLRREDPGTVFEWSYYLGGKIHNKIIQADDYAPGAWDDVGSLLYPENWWSASDAGFQDNCSIIICIVIVLATSFFPLFIHFIFLMLHFLCCSILLPVATVSVQDIFKVKETFPCPLVSNTSNLTKPAYTRVEKSNRGDSWILYREKVVYFQKRT